MARLAAEALKAYDLRVSSVRVHAFATNLLYRVRSDTGGRYMLRMAFPGWRTLADLRVIHCDLWHENVKLHRGRLRPFDFEDTVWGYRLHDLAMGGGLRLAN